MWIIKIFVSLIVTNLMNNSQKMAPMRKIRKEFLFHYPLKHKVVRNLKIVIEQVGELMVEGVGYFNPTASVLDITDRYSVDIDFIRWNGTDIRPVLEVTGGLEEIEDAAIRYFAAEFESEISKAA